MNRTVPCVRIYATLSNLNDDVLTNHGFLMIVLFSTVADWSIRHRLNVKVSHGFLHTVYKHRAQLHARYKVFFRSFPTHLFLYICDKLNMGLLTKWVQ